jgi:hypothetical protein
MLFNVDPAAGMEFFQRQIPSADLCYSLACLDFARISETAYAGFAQIFADILQSELADHRPVLFAIAHGTRFLKPGEPLAPLFIDVLSMCLASGEAAATRALDGMITAMGPDVVTNFPPQFVEQIIEQVESYLISLEPPDIVRIFRACTSIVFSYGESELAEHFRDVLFSPVAATMQDYRNQPGQIIMVCLEIVREVALSISRSPTLYGRFLGLLFAMDAEIIADQRNDDDTISPLLSATAALQVAFEGESEIEMQVGELLRLMIDRHRPEESFFRYLAELRTVHQFVDRLYDQILSSLILPSLESEDACLLGIFTLIRQIDPALVDVSWFLQVAIAGIEDFRPELNEAAVFCLQKMVSGKDPTTVHIPLLNAVLTAMLDGNHKSAFSFFAEFLRILLFATHFQPVQLTAVIVESLQQIMAESRVGLFREFAIYLCTAVESSYEFKQGFANFMLVTRKATPGDAALFRVKKKDRSGLFLKIFGLETIVGVPSAEESLLEVDDEPLFYADRAPMIDWEDLREVPAYDLGSI